MGFTVMGLVLFLLIFLPNGVILLCPPKGVPADIKDAGFIFTAMERCGQIGIALLLLFSAEHFDTAQPNVWLYFMMACIAVYYGLWIRYVLKGAEFSLLFSPLWGIPIPMAVFPVAAFLLASVWMGSAPLAVASGMFAVGHFANSWYSYRLIRRK